MSSNVLITGGAGFIGSHLAELCLKQGDVVHVLDNLSTGSLDNLSLIMNNRAFTYTIGDVTDEKILAPLIQKSEVVYHLAASVGVKLIVDKLVESIENNVKATELVLKLAHQYQRRVLITSTSEVYGRDTALPFTEEDDLRMGPTHRTRWSYACSKALDEYLALAYWHEFKLPITIVRLFNTVGERQSSQYGMVLPTFIEQALANQPISIYGLGTQTRCFCHVSDTVGAILKLMRNSNSIGQVYNIGSTDEISINDLADLVIQTLKSKSFKSYLSYQNAYPIGFDDINRRVPNINKLKLLINFKPTKTLSETINDLAVYQGQKRSRAKQSNSDS